VQVGRKHLLMRSLQALHHNGAYPLQKLVAQRVVLFAVFPQNRAVEKDGCGRLDCARGEMPDVWGKHPRPSEQISGANRFYHQRLVKAAHGFEHYLAGLDQVKSIRELAFA
jgi:hypothetical protein